MGDADAELVEALAALLFRRRYTIGELGEIQYKNLSAHGKEAWRDEAKVVLAFLSGAPSDQFRDGGSPTLRDLGPIEYGRVGE